MVGATQQSSAEVICPHCDGRQKIPSLRMSQAITCMHCNELIEDPAEHEAPKPTSDVMHSLRGRLVTEEGSLGLDNRKPPEEAPTGVATRPRFIQTERNFRPLPTSKLKKLPNRQARARLKVYLPFAALVLLAAAVIGYAAWDEFLKIGVSSTQMLGESPEQVSHYPSGQVRTRGALTTAPDGQPVLHGQWREYHQHGEIKVQGQYRDGRRTGEWQEWHTNGELAASYAFKDDQLVDRYERWHPNGWREEYGNYVDGRRHGEWRRWHPNGMIAWYQRYERGTPVGGTTSWHANGNRHMYGSYEDGQQHGRWVTSHDNGRVQIMETFEHGIRHGLSHGFYRRGQRHFVGMWKNAMREGEWVWWHGNDEIHERGTYVQGLKDGIWRTWSHTGAPLTVQHWERGVRSGEWLEFDRNGELWLKQIYVGGVLTEEIAMFEGERLTRVSRRVDDENSDIQQATWTVNDSMEREPVRHGWYREYDANGNVRMDGIYRNGERTGEFITYDEFGNIVDRETWYSGTPN